MGKKKKIIRSKKKTASKKELANAAIDLNAVSQFKSGLVSGIVGQLVKQGYSGDIVRDPALDPSMPMLGRERTEKAFAGEEDINEEMMVGDIPFDTEKENQESNEIFSNKPVSNKPVSKREVAQQQRKRMEERATNSQNQIDVVNKNARKLYTNIDEYIKGLRVAAENAQDNPYLCRKLEGLRRICVSFVRTLQNQSPRAAASLFVNTEEEG